MRESALWSALGVIGASALVALVGCGGEAMRYDPEPYREYIEGIEDLIQKAEAEPRDGAALYKLAAGLASDLGKTIENFQMRETVQNSLVNFGEYFAHKEEQGIPIDMAEARERWKKVRDNIFQSADWFQ